MDMDELRAFVAVVETGSVLGAARALRFARATLRRRLEDLEARAGVPLLVRSDSGVTPTAAGEVLAAKARLILRDMGALLGEVREASADGVAGHLRMVFPVGLPPTLFAMSLVGIRQRFPGLSARVTFADDPREALDTADVAVFFGSNEPTGAWRTLELARARMQLMASKDYLAARGTPTTLEALAGHDLALWEEPGAEEHTVPLLDGTSAPVKPYLTTRDAFLLHSLGSQGLSLVLVPYSEAVGHRDGLEPMVPVLTDLIGRDISLRLAVPASLENIPRIRALFNEVLKLIGQPELSEEEPGH